MNFETFIRLTLNRLGYDVRRVPAKGQLGQDPFRDMGRLSPRDHRPVVFDVGANVGQSVDRFRQSLDDPIIHSFEPGAEAFSELQRRNSSTPALHLNNFALGSARGVAELYENTCSDMSSILEPAKESWGTIKGKSPVAIRTLDDYCDEHGIAQIDILKSDTQGYDLEVLKGATKLLAARRIRLLYLEIIFSRMYERLPRPDEVYSFIADCGFSLVSFYTFHYQNERAGWTDALFINPDYDTAKDT